MFEWEYQRDNRRNGHMDVLMGVPERQQEKWTHGCFNGSTGETTGEMDTWVFEWEFQGDNRRNGHMCV